jgi:hypothetical protein
LLIPAKRTSALSVIALAAVILGGCGSPRTTAVEDASLQEGIVAFIDGDLDRAETLFSKVTRESRSDEDIQTAYLYLGRIYLARGDYVKSADALSTGKALGGDVRFDEYFEEAQRHLLTSPARIVQLERITRGQLAELIGERFDARLSAVMDVLPDGGLHAEESVTRPAFYVIVRRLANVLGAGEAARETLFAGGYRSSLVPPPQGPQEGTDGGFVTGREAIGALEALDRLLKDSKDE